MPFIEIRGTPLEYEWINRQSSTRSNAIVMLHEGLGSISTWSDFPERVAIASGLPVLVYSRHGYGNSPSFGTTRNVRFMHDEALLALPELLEKMSIDRPILLGHSDGGSIALIYGGDCEAAVSGLILLAPHILVEDVTIRSIAELNIQYHSTSLRRQLARHHADADNTFVAWKDVWLDPEFRLWNIEEYLSGIDCPVLAIQGDNDEYGTMEQIERIQSQVSDVQQLRLSRCGHWPYRDRPKEVLDAIATFVPRLAR